MLQLVQGLFDDGLDFSFGQFKVLSGLSSLGELRETFLECFEEEAGRVRLGDR